MFMPNSVLKWAPICVERARRRSHGRDPRRAAEPRGHGTANVTRAHCSYRTAFPSGRTVLVRSQNIEMTATAATVRNTAAIRVGRLMEVRVDAGYRTVADVNELFDAIDDEVARLPPTQKIVTIADWRHIPVMSPQAAERLQQRMALLNPRTIRSAALIDRKAPTAVLQFMRLVRAANLSDRKIFDDLDAIVSFLQEVLTNEESRRLRDFLLRTDEKAAPKRRTAGATGAK